MKGKILLTITATFIATNALAQASSEYMDLIQKGYAAYNAKQYKESADDYSKAFASMGGKGSPDDRYNGACAWSLSGNKDSAFNYLEKLATKGKFSDLGHLQIDPDLNNLHNDKRWKSLCKTVQANKDKEEEHYNKPVVAILDTVLLNDQGGRMQLEAMQSKYGFDSKEVKSLWAAINKSDSIDLIKVEKILDKYGWMGPDEIGERGNTTLFLVIQHAEKNVQEKYLPVMREAVKNGKADPGSLALLEDRIALDEGKDQIYGSQISQDAQGNSWLRPLLDPDNVDKRRASVGLGPIADYLSHWNMKWDVEAYKKQLPEILKKEGRQ